MVERFIALAPEMTLDEIERRLLKERCKIIEKDAPKFISVEQGSLWFGYSPTTVEKKMSFHIVPHGSGSRVISDTSLSSSHITMHVISNIISAVFAGFSWLFAVEIEQNVSESRSNILGRIYEWLGYTGFKDALAIASMLKIIATILVILIVIDIITSIYDYAKRETVAEKVLSLLPQQ